MIPFPLKDLVIDRELLCEELARVIHKRSLRYFQGAGNAKLSNESYRHAATELIYCTEVLSKDGSLERIEGNNGNHSAATWLCMLVGYESMEPIIKKLAEKMATNKGEV